MLVAASFYLLLILRIQVDATMVTLPATHDLNRQAGVFESDISDTVGHGISGCACQVPGARCPLTSSVSASPRLPTLGMRQRFEKAGRGPPAGRRLIVDA